MAKPRSVKGLLKRGREFLATHKWGRNTLYNPHTGAYCAVGALYGVMYDEKFDENAQEFVDWETSNVRAARLVLDAEKALSTVVRTSGPLMFITSFNDVIATKKEDVLAVYDQAIASV